MRRLLAAVFLGLSATCFAQYDGVHIEKKRFDEDNSIYVPGKVFGYRFEIVKDGESYGLSENANKSFALAPLESDSAYFQSVYLCVIAPKKNRQRTNRRQTEIVYLVPPEPDTLQIPFMISNTGAVENERNVWIHPPRASFFRCLETCPFPYIQFSDKEGSQWTDGMSIGSYWADTLWGTWEGYIPLKYAYRYAKQETLTTALGDLPCVKIDSEATSELGTSRLVAYFSEKYGFVRLEYELATGMRILLDLEAVEEWEVAQNIQQLMDIRNARVEAQRK